MHLVLNKEQARALANFYLDVAKGFTIGGIGFATLNTPGTRLFSLILSLSLALICVRFGLKLLENNNS